MPGEWFGPLLRRRLTQLGLTRADIARAVGVSKNNITRWRCNKSLPMPYFSEAISKALDLPLYIIDEAIAATEANKIRVIKRPAECGTASGASRHYRKGEGLCEACREAKREYDRQKRGYAPRKVAPCGTEGGYRRHLRRKETPCEPCRIARREYAREIRGRKLRSRNTA